MGTVKKFFKRIYNYIKKNYWSDPVWSNVIAAAIVAVFGTTITTIYIIVKTVVYKISFKQEILQLTSYLSKSSSVNNFILVIAGIVFLLIFIRFALRLTKHIKKDKVRIETETNEEYPLMGLESTVFFSYRIADAFPGERGLVWYNDPSIIVERLTILLGTPLKFRISEKGKSFETPIWWYRGSSAMFIENFERLSKTKVLIGIKELEVKRMAVNIDSAYYKCFVYLETKAERPTGLYDINDADIKRHIETFGYSWEEFGLLNKRFIRREEYEDGAAVIRSKVVDASNAKLRSRYLSDYNFLIAGHGSPYNSEKFERYSDDFFNGILTNKVTTESFFEFLSTFKKKEW